MTILGTITLAQAGYCLVQAARARVRYLSGLPLFVADYAARGAVVR